MDPDANPTLYRGQPLGAWIAALARPAADPEYRRAARVIARLGPKDFPVAPILAGALIQALRPAQSSDTVKAPGPLRPLILRYSTSSRINSCSRASRSVSEARLR